MSRSRSSSLARAFGPGIVTGLGLMLLVQDSSWAGPSVPVAGDVREVGSVMSLKELRFRGTVRQRYDFSCGAAAIATLLSNHYERPTEETEVFDEMFRLGDQQQITDVGFSLLDMKRFLVSHGYQAEGFGISLAEIEKAGVPVIALIEVRGYKHFVVVKGISPEQVLIGDPALGTRVMSKEAFEAARSPFVLLIRNQKSLGSRHFEMADELNVIQRAPVMSQMNRPEMSSADPFLPSLAGGEF